MGKLYPTPDEAGRQSVRGEIHENIMTAKNLNGRQYGDCGPMEIRRYSAEETAWTRALAAVDALMAEHGETPEKPLGLDMREDD